MQVAVVNAPSTETSNSYYPSNRPPLLPSPLLKLPLASVRAKGWLKHQLNLMVNGMTGRLMEISEFLYPDNAWLGGQGRGWEEQPYWLRGFHDLAVLTGNLNLLAEAERWIDAVLTSQEENGYFGSPENKRLAEENGTIFYDLWPHMLMLDALISHHEHSGDPRVIPLMKRFFQFCLSLPEDEFVPSTDQLPEKLWGRLRWQRWRAGDMLPHIYWLYNHIGETWLLELATRFFHHIEPPRSEWLDHHVVNFTQRFRYPANYYLQSKATWHLDQSDYWYLQHLVTWGQQPRGIFAADEQIRPGCVDPRQAIETCAIIEFAKSFYILGRVTADPTYADRCEDIMLNHFPVSQTPDLKALKYLTASNQPQLDASENHEYFNRPGRMISFSPGRIYRCCQHNVAMGWPWFVQNLWQATADNGLAAWLYAASEVTARVGQAGTKVTIREETDYPFDGRVALIVEGAPPTNFPLYLRVPAWCRGFRVVLNGQPLEVSPHPGLYVRIERTWSAGDTLAIDLPMEVSLTQWPRNGSVTVDRGPLSFSLKIAERWETCGGTPEWPEWEVFPTTPWNYGLIIDRDNPSNSLAVEKGAVADQPWTVEAAPIEIKARAKRIPNWLLENETVAELQPSPVKSDEPEEQITLIPMGCARLRIACLPTIGDGPDAREWK